MKYYITKYAIASGKIFAAEGQPSEFSDGYISTRRRNFPESFKLGRDIFASEVEALNHVNNVVIPKKVKSLEAQIKKIKAMAPKVEEPTP